MSDSLSRLATHAAYGARQLPRMAWYVGHGMAMRRLSKFVGQSTGSRERPRPKTGKPVADRRRLLGDMAALLQLDAANVAAGLYPMPADRDGSLFEVLNHSRLFFTDLPQIFRRRESGQTADGLNESFQGKRPRYYLQNFHFQSGGWLTDESAQRYDTQVEVFFSGTANAMRRQALPSLREAFAGRDQRSLHLLDVGCGTGRFIDSVKQVWPRLRVTGVDLSEAYLRAAKVYLGSWSRTGLVVGNAESIPVPDESVDAVTSTFLFHELPPRARRSALAEFSRVLKPGGRLIIVDSLQCGDDPAYEGTLELFPQNFHEPFFTSYIKEDFAQLGRDRGLVHIRNITAFVSKVMVFDKAA
jgi:ubiquinone/menaquinone biosynthesis C-methylase UbiE